MPSIGACLMPSTVLGRRDAGDFEDGRHHVDDVHELLAQAALVLDVAGQETAMFWRMPPSFEAFCLNQVKGVSKAQDQPADMWL